MRLIEAVQFPAVWFVGSVCGIAIIETWDWFSERIHVWRVYRSYRK